MTPVAAPDRAHRRLDELRRAHPEWHSLLELWSAVIEASADPAWGAIRVTLAAGRAPDAPLLAHARAELPVGLAADWFHRLVGRTAPVAALGVLRAAIDQDRQYLARAASDLAMASTRLEAIAAVAVVPVLTACAARTSATAPIGWNRGYCPTCGAWPAMAEYRGLDRARRLRCLRCGGDWAFPPYRCPFCDAEGHRHAGALVGEGETETRRIETCNACRGYVKALTTLRAWTPGEIATADLATVDLDLAAIEHGCERPATAPVRLGLRLEERTA